MYRPKRHLRWVGAMALTLSLTVSGCASDQTAAGQAQAPTGHKVAGPCGGAEDTSGKVASLIDSSQIVAVQQCRITDSPNSKSSTEIMEANDTAKISQLVQALSEPVQSVNDCPDGSNLQLEGFTFRTRSNEYLAPDLKINQCGLPNDSVAGALSSMTFHRLES